MKRYIPLLIIWSCLQMINMNAHDLPVVPYPQSVENIEGEFNFNPEARIVLGNGSTDAEVFLSKEIQSAIKNHVGFSLTIVNGDQNRTSGDIFIGLAEHSSLAGSYATDRFTDLMREEGYLLDIQSDGVFLIAYTSPGLYYGGMSLIQLVENRSGPEILPGLLITDYPRFRYRGISDDISRGQVSTLENFKTIVQRLARYKQNVYMPYLEDMFRFESHPLIGKGRGALTPEEVKELDDFARKHHVELIPIFQTLGHMENMLLKPEYVDYAEFPGAASLNISDERIYDLLQEFFDEIVPAFSSKYFHMAADESWDVGRGASRDLVSEKGFGEAHAQHFIQVYEMLRDMGKEVIMYADIATGLGEAIPGYPEVLDHLPDEITVVYWDYWLQRSYTHKAKILQKAEQPFFVSPGVWNWHPIYPDNLTAPINIRNMAHTGVNTDAIGFINSSWGDYGGETLRELNWLGYAYGAEVSWSPETDSFEKSSTNFIKDFYGTSDIRLQSLYSLLANIGNKINNQDLWQPPFMPPAGTNSWDLNAQFLINFNQIKSNTQLAQEILRELRREKVVTRNAAHLDYLEFSLKKANLFVEKIESIKFLSQFRTDDYISDEVKKKSLFLADNMIAKTEELRDVFTELWLRTNREANLDRLITHYFSRQISYWKEMKEELQRGNHWIDHRNPGTFIYHPDATPYVSRGTRKSHSYFRKTFNIDDIDNLDKMLVQTVGDTYLRIYVNGEKVGESYAKRALSLIVQMARTKFWDITDYLVQGENVIAVESHNYLHAGSAGFSWYSELFFTDGTKLPIYSDSSWIVTDTVTNEWYGIRTDTDDWLQAQIVYERVPLLDKPNFEHNRKSWIIDRVWTATLED